MTFKFLSNGVARQAYEETFQRYSLYSKETYRERYSKGTVHHTVQDIFEDDSARGLNAKPMQKNKQRAGPHTTGGILTHEYCVYF